MILVSLAFVIHIAENVVLWNTLIHIRYIHILVLHCLHVVCTYLRTYVHTKIKKIKYIRWDACFYVRRFPWAQYRFGAKCKDPNLLTQFYRISLSFWDLQKMNKEGKMITMSNQRIRYLCTYVFSRKSFLSWFDEYFTQDTFISIENIGYH